MVNYEGDNKWAKLIHLAASIATVGTVLVAISSPSIGFIKEYLGYPISSFIPLVGIGLLVWGVYKFFRFVTREYHDFKTNQSATSSRLAVESEQHKAEYKALNQSIGVVVRELAAKIEEEKTLRETRDGHFAQRLNRLEAELSAANKVRAVQDESIIRRFHPLEADVDQLKSEMETAVKAVPDPIMQNRAKVAAALTENAMRTGLISRA